MEIGKMTTAKEKTAEAQRAYQCGECGLDTMRAAQRAYDLERTAPQREAEAQRQRDDWERQQAVWASIGDDDVPRIRQMAIEADCVREATVERFCQQVSIRRVVPPTSHWAHWHDNDAVLYHGMTSESLVERFLALSTEPWDGTYAHLWFAI